MSVRGDDEFCRDERQQDLEDSRRRARLWHWCDLCHGHTQRGSPCYEEPEREEEETASDDEGEQA